MNNKRVLVHCPNFYKISDFSCNEDDYISQKIISVYKEYIFEANLGDLETLKKVESLDKVISKYIDDYYFRKEMKSSLAKLRVRKGSNVIHEIVEFILKMFNNYEEGYTRKIYISIWI